MTKKSETVTVYPNPDGTFIDGVPAIEQEVTAEDAEWMCAHGAFLREKPQPVEAPTD